MMLYVLRHGIAEDAPPGGNDAERALTPRGRLKLVRAVRGMRRLGLVFDAIWTSPLVRAVETAALVAEGYRGTVTPRVQPALAVGVSPAETLRALRTTRDEGHVLVVGHEPGLSGLVSLVCTGSVDALGVVLKKGGLVALEMPEPPGRGHGQLRWMLTPRQLRRCGA